jgi:porin
MRKNCGIAFLFAFAGTTMAAQPEQPATDLPGLERADQPELAGFMERELGPQDLPGREKGDRDRAPEPKPVEPAPAPEITFWSQDRMTGNWWGARKKLEDTGINFNGSFTLNTVSVVEGGARERASTRTLWDFNVAFDFEAMCDWKGASAFVAFSSSDERSALADAGSFQAPSNIEYGRNIDEIGEAWFQQEFWDGVLRLKAGKIDANAEFAFVSAAGDFTSSAAGVSPNILAIPTVPAQATGIVAFVYPTESWYVGGGFFDGATQDGIRTGGRGPADFFSDSRSQSWYWIAETGYSWDCGETGGGRAAIGGWYATGDFARFDGGIDEGAEGFYALAEQQVWRRGSDDDNKGKGLFVFGQYGWADKDVTVIGQHVAAGVTLKGTCSARSDDGAGFYWSMIDASTDVLTGADRDEHLFELYYKAQVTPWMYVQPCVQHIINPSGRASIDDATLLGIQVGVAF